MDEALQTFESNVRAARAARGWTQEELSARTGLAVVQISRIGLPGETQQRHQSAPLRGTKLCRQLRRRSLLPPVVHAVEPMPSLRESLKSAGNVSPWAAATNTLRELGRG